MVEVLGEAHWLKPPTLARHHSKHLHELFYEGGPGKGHGTNKPPPTGRVQKGQKETPHVSPPPRILLTSIHLGWTRRALPGRTLSQNDWLKTTRKLILSPQTPRLRATEPFPNKTSCFVSICLSSDNSFLSVRWEPSFGPWKGSSFLQQKEEIVDHYLLAFTICIGQVSWPFLGSTEQEYILLNILNNKTSYHVSYFILVLTHSGC